MRIQAPRDIAHAVRRHGNDGKLRGVESQGMLLAASHEETLVVLRPDKPIAAGATVR